MDAVDHHRHHVQAGEVAAHQLAQGPLGGLNEPAGHRALRGRGGCRLDRLAHRFQTGPVAAGRQPGQHPLHRHHLQGVNLGEVLIGRDRHLASGVADATDPGSTHPDPAAAQHHAPRLCAVTDGGPTRRVPPLRAADAGDVLFHDRVHHLQPGGHGQRQQPLLRRAGQLGQRHRHLLRQLDLNRLPRRRLPAPSPRVHYLLGHRWWSSVRVVGMSW